VNSTNSNEQGTYLALTYNFLKPLTYSGSIDIHSFPFLKYQVDSPSDGTDIFHQLEYKPNKKFIAQVRYRERRKQENKKSTDESGTIQDFLFRTLRLSTTIKIDNTWSYGLRIEFAHGSGANYSPVNGTVVSQDIFYKPMGSFFSFNVRYAIFNCPDFDTRIYGYENDVQGAFSVPFYYGSGSRFYTNVNLHVSRRINLSVRYSTTLQDDPESFSRKSDIKIQLRVSL
jgi:hypothetical protein